MRRAVVVGAGLGGLASAIALRHRGWEVTILERRQHAADGVRSTVRAAFWPEVTVRDTGHTAFRTVADHRLAEGGESWGGGDLVGLAPLPGDRTYLYVMVPTAEAPTVDPLPWLRARLAGWHEPIAAVLDAVDGPVLVHPLADIRPPATWHRGRVALLGDAAHAMTPNLGQGAAQAFLDAVVLAAEATAEPTSLAAYERRRRPLAEAVARRSRSAGDVAAWRSPVAVALRNALVGALPAGASARALDHLLGTPDTTSSKETTS